jgi:hypothetical protein
MILDDHFNLLSLNKFVILNRDWMQILTVELNTFLRTSREISQNFSFVAYLSAFSVIFAYSSLYDSCNYVYRLF